MSTHDWRPTESGHRCRNCRTLRLPPDRKYSRYKYRSATTGREKYHVGKCWMPTAPEHSSATTDGARPPSSNATAEKGTEE